jgi:hypothetical protein
MHVSLFPLWLGVLGAASAARPVAPVTANLSNGVTVTFLTEAPTGMSDGVVTGGTESVVRAFTDLAACTYFGYELRARALPDARIEVRLGPLGAQGEQAVERHAEFVRAGCSRPQPLAVPAPRFPPPHVYADGESLSIALLTNPKTGRVLEDHISLGRLPSGVSSPDRADLEREMESLREQLHEKEELFLATAPSDRAALAEWLREPDRGVARILPRERYDRRLIVNGGGAYYSFSRLSHDYQQCAELELQQGDFSTGFAGADYGFLAPVGDVALDLVTLDHPAVTSLAAHNPPSREPDARVQQRRSGEGWTAGDYKYRGRAPARVGTTYVLREISYEHGDTLVAFRVLREDTDGSLILQWKILKRFPVPHLVRD